LFINTSYDDAVLFCYAIKTDVRHWSANRLPNIQIAAALWWPALFKFLCPSTISNIFDNVRCIFSFVHAFFLWPTHNSEFVCLHTHTHIFRVYTASECDHKCVRGWSCMQCVCVRSSKCVFLFSGIYPEFKDICVCGNAGICFFLKRGDCIPKF